MRQRHRGRSGDGVFSGLLFLAVGLILLFGNLSLFPLRPFLLQWWPTLLIVIGVKQLVLRRGRLSWISGLFWMGTGALFLSSTLGYLNIGISGLLWPVMLIWFGVLTMLGCSTSCESPINDRSGS